MHFEGLPADLVAYINYEEGLKRIMNNAKIYSKTLNMFAATKEFDNLKQALSEGDMEKCTHSAHAIKGMAANLSIAKVYEISSTLQDEFEKGTLNNDKVSELFQAADKTIEYIALLQEKMV
ncbi:MAG: Hpt domain-containing protein [Defluviitaleaceae bacterium]|nr:Hpt domain-containing protein [Defluviitaleaceae bacterium]